MWLVLLQLDIVAEVLFLGHLFLFQHFIQQREMYMLSIPQITVLEEEQVPEKKNFSSNIQLQQH
jgi:hypothetical protein